MEARDSSVPDSIADDTPKRLLEILAGNWQAEIRGCYTYKTLAEREPDPARKRALHLLATAEKYHAQLWSERIRALGETEPTYHGPRTGKVDTFANRVGGKDLILRRIERDESRAAARYTRQLRDLNDGPSIAILEEVIASVQEHHGMLIDLIRDRRPLAPSFPEAAQHALDSLMTARQGDRRNTPDWIGDAIYGVNDGLGAIFGIVSGVSGATLGNSKFVLLAGMAGMIASALSMGSGAYLAAKSEREIFHAEFARERNAVEYNEPEARQILSLSYQARGLPAAEADRFVEYLARDKEEFIRTLARERLNTTAERLRRPWSSAVSGALSTAIGASIPILPFFFLSGISAVIWAAVISLAAHFAVGASKSLITIRPWWSSGLEMTMIGAIEGVVTYAIGIGIGKL
jgi:VIT1/CCC1 family predicted Fe2+/Mn2+ transporter